MSATKERVQRQGKASKTNMRNITVWRCGDSNKRLLISAMRLPTLESSLEMESWSLDRIHVCCSKRWEPMRALYHIRLGKA